MALLYKPFASSNRLVAASKSAPSLAEGAYGPPVLLIQGALVDLGFKLPRSTRKIGKPDGLFDSETTRVVAEYQASRKLKKSDGIIGRVTMLALGKDMLAMSHPVPMKPPPPPPLRAILNTRSELRIRLSHPTQGRGRGNLSPKRIPTSA